ncbi:hypothetical protein [Maribellus mangrovi]|uniref:hypothetical protein n=1 Tax=Maribellus mangrovi TaxID=3133146 RepID=UPI0030EC65C7
MKRVVIIMMVIFLQLSCNKKQEEPKEKATYYFLYEKPWEYRTFDNRLCYTYSYPPDSARIGELMNSLEAVRHRVSTYAKKSIFLLDSIRFHGEQFELRHNIGIDTVFVKDPAYLDSITYYNTQFFSDTVKVRKFWDGYFNKMDTLAIYVIKREGDSLTFRKVNRYVMSSL